MINQYLIFFIEMIPRFIYILAFQIPLLYFLYILPRNYHILGIYIFTVHFVLFGFIFIDLGKLLFEFDLEIYVFYLFISLVAIAILLILRARAARKRPRQLDPYASKKQRAIIIWATAGILPVILIYTPIFSRMSGTEMFLIFVSLSLCMAALFLATRVLLKRNLWSGIEHLSLAFSLSLTFCTFLAYASGVYAEKQLRMTTSTLGGTYSLTSGDHNIAGALDMTIFNMRPETVGFFTEMFSSPSATLAWKQNGEPFNLYWSWPHLAFVNATKLLLDDSPC